MISCNIRQGFAAVFFSISLFVNSSITFLSAADSIPLQPTPAKLNLVPQNLLKLVHAPEVQQELELAGTKLSSFLEGLAKIDGPWWRSRIKSEEEQRAIIATQEALLLDVLKATLSPEKLNRLQQIELQSQGTRMFARPDVAQAINITKAQNEQLKDLYAGTDKLAKKVQQAKTEDKALIAELQTAREAEAKGIATILSEKQKAAFSKLVGTPFDTMKLTRIYPLAPELIDSGYWAGEAATTLADQRGHVVLLHFYAFQCHNCVANFEHYKRWHETLSSRGVSVIGIQTPETIAERDVVQVQKAAKDRGFTFPVLIDNRSRNWDAWANTMWPTVYVIDKNGYIRFWTQGELNWQGATIDKTIESLVDNLLKE